MRSEIAACRVETGLARILGVAREKEIALGEARQDEEFEVGLGGELAFRVENEFADLAKIRGEQLRHRNFDHPEFATADAF